MGVVIPRYDERTTTPLRGVEGHLSAPDLGPDLGAAVHGFGRAIDQARVDYEQAKEEEAHKAAQQAAKLKQQQQEEAAAYWLAAGPRVTQQIADKVEKFEAETPDDGTGYAEGVRKIIEDSYGEFDTHGGNNPALLDLVARSKANALDTVGVQAIRREADIRETWKGSQLGIGLNTTLQTIAGAKSVEDVDALAQKALVDMEPGIQAMADPEVRTKTRLTTASAIADAALKRKAELTPDSYTTGGPDLSGPIAAKVRALAPGAGLKPDDALAVLALENAKLDPKAKPNVKGTTVYGLFQLNDDRWKDMGGTAADRDNVDRQIELGLKSLAQTRDVLKAKLGREPTVAELYLTHQQGDGGGPALLLAPPGAKAVDVIAPFYKDRATAISAIVNNGGTADMSAGDFVAKWRKRVDRAQGSLIVSTMASPQGRAQAATIAQGEIKARNEALINGLELDVESGAKGEADIKAALDAGWLRADDHRVVTLYQAAEKKRLEMEQKAKDDARVQAALQGGAPLDPTNDKDKKIINSDYDERAATWKDPDQWLGNSIAYSRAVGALPDTFRGRLIGGLQSNDPGTRAKFATVYGTLRAANPALIQSLPAYVQADANYLLRMEYLGLSPAEAVQKLQLNERLGVDVVRNREQAFNQAIGGAKRTALIQRLGVLTQQDKTVTDEQGAWGSAFNLPPEMQAEFYDLAKANYIQMGDVDAAERAAYDQLRRTWAPSAFNGGRTFMKDAPEAVYGIGSMTAGDNARWMREQAQWDLQRRGQKPVTVLPGLQPGMIQQGNIDLTARPRVYNRDGSVSTVLSMSFEQDGKEILVPLVSDDGRIMSKQEAIATYQRTGRSLGVFSDEASATAYAKRLHDQQDAYYLRPPEKGAIKPDPSLRLQLAPSVLSPDGGPVYYLFKDVGGIQQPVLGANGRPVVWRPDWNTSPERLRMSAKDAEKRDREWKAAQAARRREQQYLRSDDYRQLQDLQQQQQTIYTGGGA